MIEEREEVLSEAESRALRSLGAERTPPPGMEERVVSHLKMRGLLNAGAGRRWLRVAAGVAACLALFVAGAAVGARFSSLISQPEPAGLISQPEPAGERFVLLLYEGAGYQASAPGMERERIAEYGAWARGLRRSGELVAGEKLKVGEQVLGSAVVPAGTAGGYPGMRPGILGGYFIIAAKDGGQAREIASTCPHLRHGGWIVIRQIDPV
jgi:hypothetical protein